MSFNHLGNNDGKNLSAPKQLQSKEISKSNVDDDMVGSNRLLYEDGKKPDHSVVIKYVPYVADSKRAMDEYTSEIFIGGLNTIVLHNTCEVRQTVGFRIGVQCRIVFISVGFSVSRAYHSRSCYSCPDVSANYNESW